MKINKRDSIFLTIVFVVILVLVVGTTERTTKAVPDNDTHNQTISRSDCMTCHSVEGIKPQPLGHPKANQCFQCHKQPDHWVGNNK
jgi:hypothetical protein